jgi:hypothetical protein
LRRGLLAGPLARHGGGPAEGALNGAVSAVPLSSTAHGQSSAHSQPFVLILQLDAWNIRERNDWGHTKALRKKGKEPERWHWVYTATLFRLDQRGHTASKRPVISERGFVATRAGLEIFEHLVYAEALRRGLTRAAEVLVLADGAAWIWNLVENRFRRATQRVDLYHVKQHLWAVAGELYDQDKDEARQWLRPLFRQLEGKNDGAAEVNNLFARFELALQSRTDVLGQLDRVFDGGGHGWLVGVASVNGTASPGGASGSGSSSWFDSIITRGQAGITRASGSLAGSTSDTDYAPWGGVLTFNSAAPWYFDSNPSTSTLTTIGLLSDEKSLAKRSKVSVFILYCRTRERSISEEWIAEASGKYGVCPVSSKPYSENSTSPSSLEIALSTTLTPGKRLRSTVANSSRRALRAGSNAMIST